MMTSTQQRGCLKAKKKKKNQKRQLTHNKVKLLMKKCMWNLANTI